MRTVPSPAIVSLAIVARRASCCCRFQLDDYHHGLAAQVAIYFIAILGLNILTGYTGQISIGHGAFMAIGGYTTAVMSHYHDTNLILTLPLAFAISFVLRRARRDPGAAPLRRLPRARDVRVRRLGAAVRAEVLEVPRRQQRHPDHDHADATLALRRHAGRCAGIVFVRRLARAPRAHRPRVPRRSRQRDGRGRRRASRSRSTRRSPSASRRRSPASPARCFVLATNGFAQPNEFAVFLSLELLVGAAVAGLGSLWGVLVGALFIGLLPDGLRRRAADRVGARPGRRLRPDRDRDHAPAPDRLRRAAPPARGRCPGSGRRRRRRRLDSRFNSD